MAHTIQWLPPPTARQLTFSESARAQKLRRRNVAGAGARVRKYKITCARACAYVCVWVRACAAREEYVVIKCLIARWKKSTRACHSCRRVAHYAKCFTLHITMHHPVGADQRREPQVYLFVMHAIQPQQISVCFRFAFYVCVCVGVRVRGRAATKIRLCADTEIADMRVLSLRFYCELFGPSTALFCVPPRIELFSRIQKQRARKQLSVQLQCCHGFFFVLGCCVLCCVLPRSINKQRPARASERETHTHTHRAIKDRAHRADTLN